MYWSSLYMWQTTSCSCVGAALVINEYTYTSSVVRGARTAGAVMRRDMHTQPKALQLLDVHQSSTPTLTTTHVATWYTHTYTATRTHSSQHTCTHCHSLVLVHSVVCMHVVHIHIMPVLYYISTCRVGIVHKHTLEESLQLQGCRHNWVALAIKALFKNCS